MKTIPERFGNFVKLAANNWRLHNNRTLTVPAINEMLNPHGIDYGDINANREKYFGDFARCPEYENWKTHCTYPFCKIEPTGQ